ncbi:sulfatase [Fulvivirgaceae bacterium BMA10]|uniref:Sulfatase n=1 Tax=Splendidivirga corallicola TaxID=3051826 RepID=A0ABT8KN73_9BACT|nr:sulfatase [Fulvivirgaceae bacterium BMA10]
MKSGLINRISILLLLTIAFSNCSEPEEGDKSQAPNLLIIYPDQMRGQAMGFLGDEPVLTPNLDRFAGESLVLTEAVANFPICSPSRAMLMTGKYPHANGVLHNCNTLSEPFGHELKESAVCWSDILSDKGYDLGYIGKWHLDNPREPYVDTENNKGTIKWNEWTPSHKRHGFNFWYAYGTYDHHMRPMYWKTDAGREAFHFVDQWGPEHEADVAIDYIKNKSQERDPSKPFALMVSINPPHSPYAAVPEKYKKPYETIPMDSLTKRLNIPEKGTQWGDFYRNNIKDYYAMITGVDEQFGRILKALKEEGLDKNTIVVFTSDHGNCLGIQNIGSKDYHYEESMTVPFIIRWPEKIKGGTDDLLISTPDIYPTLMELMGFKESIPEDIMGTSYASNFLTGEGPRPTSQLYMYVYPGEPDVGRRGIRTDHYTLMINYRPNEGNAWWQQNQADSIELFNNYEDPYQLTNIAGTQPALEKKLSEELKQWLQKTRDPWIKHFPD